jgi:5-(carboxyamino)imidazole ribonucleotide mutase
VTLLPVLGVPMNTHALEGKDSLLSIMQMPAGIPVGTLAIGRPGAINAALLAASILALSNATIAKKLQAWRKRQTGAVAKTPGEGRA